jgi:hypothetical protein
MAMGESRDSTRRVNICVKFEFQSVKKSKNDEIFLKNFETVIKDYLKIGKNH